MTNSKTAKQKKEIKKNKSRNKQRPDPLFHDLN